ncbi:excreted virulence factor EspC (type VII ESX diderm) [Knoellia remsis]|uniref:Excreted virulence factor EspC (Type VII ESX diderm) n=1 Tax=Knoellia remsis TaxID=407159 RepID=A0A2T0UTQ8_9MICO|nr:type VII secretion target [Knoellia remsis]PRY61293.1 excreted virulence factor EspC (type VII ESX diderm) [Knoellia remsis]
MKFDVNPEVLRSHAGNMDRESSNLDGAKSALQTAVSDDAFGLLCSFLAAPVREVGPDAQSAVSGMSTAAGNTADGMRLQATAYEFVDFLAQAGITSAGGGGR